MILSETAQRLLSELEEAGQENIPALLNAVTQKMGAPSELAQVKDGLLSLVEAGYVRVAVKSNESKHWVECGASDSAVIVGKMSTVLRYRTDGKYWADAGVTGPPFEFRLPQIVTTDEGQAVAQKIVRERGYQWWRTTK